MPETAKSLSWEHNDSDWLRMIICSNLKINGVSTLFMNKKKPQHPVQKFEIDGNQFIAHGIHSKFWDDIYHYSMTSTWPMFFAVIAALFMALNFVFALLYALEPQSVANLYPQGFWGGFFFSVETLATVGYGDMHPQTVYAHIISTIEIFVGMSGIAMMTGVMFARFSRPKAKILFTRHPVTYIHNGEQVLSIRIANTRLNIIAEASAKLRLLRLEPMSDNSRFLRITDLPLKRDQHPMFSLGWNLFHVIDEHSPLFGQTSADLEKSEARLILSFDGVDETTNQTIRARHVYGWATIRHNHRYIDFSTEDESKSRHLDYNLFDEVRPEET